jgi:hypothetical protein
MYDDVVVQGGLVLMQSNAADVSLCAVRNVQIGFQIFRDHNLHPDSDLNGARQCPQLFVVVVVVFGDDMR